MLRMLGCHAGCARRTVSTARLAPQHRTLAPSTFSNARLARGLHRASSAALLRLLRRDVTAVLLEEAVARLVETVGERAAALARDRHQARPARRRRTDLVRPRA